jgi:hypothetical protein
MSVSHYTIKKPSLTQSENIRQFSFNLFNQYNQFESDIMNTKVPSKCICSNEGYAPDCPQAFMQGGKLMHTLDNENKLKPRVYDVPAPLNIPPPPVGQKPNVMDYRDADSSEDENSSNSSWKKVQAEDQKDDSRMMLQRAQTMPVDRFNYRAETADQYKWGSDKDFQQSNRMNMKNFDPLQYNGITMTEATIGGYQLDMEVASEKMQKFVPLPPVSLPIIFIDRDLNFSHHFFQGLEILLGRKYVKSIVSREKYSDRDSKKILPALKQLIMSGTKPADTELTIFVKRILSGTFNTCPTANVTPEHDELIVAANLWGFQYIEPSMRCRDNELRMWLDLSYEKYRVAWFNNFKSSGIPDFAKDGVQDRYDSKGDREIKQELRQSELESRRARDLEREQERDANRRGARESGRDRKKGSFFDRYR